ncbi:SDR family NAD(P)-dependent oxidoreductase, partial [bacterium]|nr:SDR family NAD(P)-dependent oxidoreductase [bacterium]
MRFAELGASGILIAGRREEKLKEAAPEIEKAGAAVETFAVDIRDSSRVEEMVKRCIDKFGRIDVLLNNAAGNFPCHAEDL